MQTGAPNKRVKFARIARPRPLPAAYTQRLAIKHETRMVKFDDLLLAFEFVSSGAPYEHEAYLCIETGKIHYRSALGDEDGEFPEDIADSERYVAVPHKNDLGLGKRLALRFVESALPDAIDDVHEIFRHKGAYSRFKSLLVRHGALQHWFEYEEKVKKEALLRWCEDRGIETHG